jgi:hypothetical protein
MTDESLPTLLPYRNFFPDGALDLRGNGVSVAYNLVGPSPESATLTDIAACARQLAAAFVHLGTPTTWSSCCFIVNPRRSLRNASSRAERRP